MNYQKWLKEREYGLGGSHCAAILGLHPYMTNIDLWELKTGRKKPEDISEKEVVKYGQRAEAPLRELFILDYPEYEVYHKEFDLIRCKKNPFLYGSLDGELTDKTTGIKGIYEGKTSLLTKKNDFAKWNNQIPQHYYCQILHYFIIHPEKQFAILKAQLKTERVNDDNFKEVNEYIRHYYFLRQKCEKDILYLEENEVYFWKKNVEKDIRPNLIVSANIEEI